MSLEIHIHITTDGEPTAREQQILAALGGGIYIPDQPAKPDLEKAKATERTIDKLDKPELAKPKATKKTTEAKPKPEPAEEESDDDAPALSDAVKLATKRVSEGRAKDVKAALTAVGAKKVSELKGDQIAEFLADENLA